jgi:hypothetical protein
LGKSIIRSPDGRTLSKVSAKPKTQTSTKNSKSTAKKIGKALIPGAGIRALLKNKNPNVKATKEAHAQARGIKKTAFASAKASRSTARATTKAARGGDKAAKTAARAAAKASRGTARATMATARKQARTIRKTSRQAKLAARRAKRNS